MTNLTAIATQRSVWGTHVLDETGHVPKDEARFIAALFEVAPAHVPYEIHLAHSPALTFVKAHFRCFLGWGFKKGAARLYYRKGLLQGMEVGFAPLGPYDCEFSWGECHCIRFDLLPTRAGPDVEFLVKPKRENKAPALLARQFLAVKGVGNEFSRHQLLEASLQVQESLCRCFGEDYRLAH